MGFLKRTLFLVLTTTAAFAPAATLAQISPGKLSQAHADLEGMRKCLKCHDLGEGPSDNKCMECHGEIAWSLGRNRGFHRGVAGDGKKECYECHSEHAGRDFQLVHWPGGVNSFDHSNAGYELAGKHAGLKCRDCHKSGLIQEDLSRFGDHVKADRTYLGLGTACLDCHSDPHRGQLQGDCTGCHTNDGWKPVPGFDHARTAFVLTGRHVRLKCVKCHPTVEAKNADYPQSASFVRYTGLAHNNCTPCHTDVHRGRYGEQCARCHNTSDWRDIPAEAFDHSRTRYPLLGLHAGLQCEKCHAPGTKKSPLSHERCADCHADTHRDQFAARPDGGACESCHTVKGFAPALYTVEHHAETRFALTGAHLAQPCVACHPLATSGDGVTFRMFAVDGSSCESCHIDPHAGQFRTARPSKDCTVCHGNDAWLPVAIDHDRDTAYRLEGQHRRVPCAGCHVPVTEGGTTFIRYKPIEPSCRNCHDTDNLKLGKNRFEPATGVM